MNETNKYNMEHKLVHDDMEKNAMIDNPIKWEDITFQVAITIPSMI